MHNALFTRITLIKGLIENVQKYLTNSKNCSSFTIILIKSL